MILPNFAINGIALLALLLVPTIWIISRIKPMPPKPIIFPAVRFLRNLQSQNLQVNEAPQWLKILRAIGLFALIVGISNPIIYPNQKAEKLPENIIFIVEDSYSAAPFFEETKAQIITQLENLKSQSKTEISLYLISTSQAKTRIASAGDFQTTINQVRNLAPKPIFFDHEDARLQLLAINKRAKIYYFSDGLLHKNTLQLLGEIRKYTISTPLIYRPVNGKFFVLKSIKRTNLGYDFNYLSNSVNDRINIDFMSQNGLALANGAGTSGLNSIRVANEKAKNIAYARINGQKSAGSVFLFDAFDKRPNIGIEKAPDADLPILSDNNYIKAAANQFADIQEASIEELAKSQLNAIIIGDRPGFSDLEAQKLNEYITRGGILIRYIGPGAISVNEDNLLPAPLNKAPRNIESALTVKPIIIAPFGAGSPFAGIVPPKDIAPKTIATIQAQDNMPEILARLSDGTPLISARKIGKGEIIAIHTSAAPYWSDIAFSGLQVSLLRRLVLRAEGQILPVSIRPSNTPLYAKITLDGFGNIIKSPNNIAPIHFHGIPILPSLATPPGIYENGQSRLIINANDTLDTLENLPKSIDGFAPLPPQAKSAIKLAPFFYALFGLVFIFDFFFIHFIVGQSGFGQRIGNFVNAIKRFLRPNMALIVLFSCLLPLLPMPSNAQNAPNVNANNSQQIGMRMAYLITSDRANNDIAKRGLEGLKSAIIARTSIRVSGVVGLDAQKDELALYPIIYWRIGANSPPLDASAQQALNQYMRNGGMLLIDTQSAKMPPQQARQLTQNALRGLVVPPLAQVNQNHVLTKSFYLLQGFQGHYSNSKIWAQNPQYQDNSANDGVSPILIFDGDFASAWVNGPHGAPIVSIEGGEMGRNNAFNSGINIYMYALTGQYKADQVHIRAILDRLKNQRHPQ